jgi:rhodanese-related sulfurtransferase
MEKLLKMSAKKLYLLRFFLIVSASILGNSRNIFSSGRINNDDKFELIRVYIQAWLSESKIDKAIISSPYLKENIIDEWAIQSKKYQIVSVRSPDDYTHAGHIPNAINIYWVNIITDESLSELDFKKIQILYCYYGHGSMITYPILSLLGCKCKSLNFGMMAWNLDALVKEPWDKKADYDLEIKENTSKEIYPPPILTTGQTEVKGIIKEMARKYLESEGSPVILSSDVKDIIDDWEQKSTEYQIVDIRRNKDYKSGHIPHSINIPLINIAGTDNLKKLDPARTVIIYSENGQTGQMATTLINLLGYHAVNMKFGMMDWNKGHVKRSLQWDGSFNFPFERSSSEKPITLL